MKKKWLKRVGIGCLLLFIGAIIGAVIVGARDNVYVERIVEKNDGSRIAEHIEERIEGRIAIQEEEVVEIVEKIVVAPKIRIPQPSERTIRIEYDGLSFFQVVGAVANLFTAVLLIGIGLVLLIRRRQAPKEKQPEN